MNTIHCISSSPCCSSSSNFLIVKPCNIDKHYYKNAPQPSFSMKRPRRVIASVSKPNKFTSILPPSPENENLNQFQSRFNSFLDSGKDALYDLQTLINVVDDKQRISFFCHKIALDKIGGVIIWGFVLFAGLKQMLVTVAWLKNAFKDDNHNADKPLLESPPGDNPPVESDCETTPEPDLEPADNKDLEPGGKAWRRKKYADSVLGKMPEWWPISVESDDLLVSLDQREREWYQNEANRLLKVLGDLITAGEVIMDDDIIEVRRTCRTSGVRAPIIDTPDMQETIYRMAVQYVLDFCIRWPSDWSFVEIDGEDCRQFIAGFAENIGLETILAAKMIKKAVAARTQSRLLKAWDLEMHGKHSEAIWELQRIRILFRFFPPEKCSAEIEMVGRDLTKRFTDEQRMMMLAMIDEASYGEAERTSAVEALGLVR